MIIAKATPPKFSSKEAQGFAEKLFGIEVTSVKSMGSFIDQDFLVIDDQEREYTLKIHDGEEQEAVRESLMLLKNNVSLLPISPTGRVLVVGEAADSIAKAAGGWTLTWQGGSLGNSLFPNGESILSGIKTSVNVAEGNLEYSYDASYQTKPDVAIVIFGEDPYAEFVGDREHFGYDVKQDKEINFLRKLKADDIPVISVFISGRPRWVNPEINSSDAFIAA